MSDKYISTAHLNNKDEAQGQGVTKKKAAHK